jgi:hypothetical protein
MSHMTPTDSPLADEYAFGLGASARVWSRGAELHDLWERVTYAFSDGGCGLVVLTGASGSGKSHLAGRHAVVRLERDRVDTASTSSATPGRGATLLDLAAQSKVSVRVLEARRDCLLLVDERGEASSQRLLVVDQAERLLPPIQPAASGQARLTEELRAELERARAIAGGGRAAVTCLLVMRDQDLARAASLAEVFGLRTFPSSMVYRLGGLSSDQQQELLAHWVGDCADGSQLSSWEGALSEVLPLHVKIAADAIIAVEREPQLTEAWAIDADLLKYYPSLLISHAASPERLLREGRQFRRRPLEVLTQLAPWPRPLGRNHRSLLHVCFAMAHCCWVADRLAGGEGHGTVASSVARIREQLPDEHRTTRRAVLLDILERLRALNIVVDVGKQWEFAHEYFAGAFSALEKDVAWRSAERWARRVRRGVLWTVGACAILVAFGSALKWSEGQPKLAATAANALGSAWARREDELAAYYLRQAKAAADERKVAETKVDSLSEDVRALQKKTTEKSELADKTREEWKKAAAAAQTQAVRNEALSRVLNACAGLYASNREACDANANELQSRLAQAEERLRQAQAELRQAQAQSKVEQVTQQQAPPSAARAD